MPAAREDRDAPSLESGVTEAASSGGLRPTAQRDACAAVEGRVQRPHGGAEALEGEDQRDGDRDRAGNATASPSTGSKQRLERVCRCGRCLARGFTAASGCGCASRESAARRRRSCISCTCTGAGTHHAPMQHECPHLLLSRSPRALPVSQGGHRCPPAQSIRERDSGAGDRIGPRLHPASTSAI